MIMSLAPAKRTPCANSWMKPLVMSVWTGTNMCRSTRAISARPRWITCWPMPRRARRELGWEPKVNFHELVRIMVDADLELAGLDLPGEGKRILEERFNGWHRWEHQVVSMER